MGTFKQKLRSLMILLLLFASARSFAGAPTWSRVDYTQSTTFVGVVEIKKYTSTYPYTPIEGDYIGAFVKGECRMIAQIFTHEGKLYVSSVIQGSDTCVTNEPNCTPGGPEEVEFRLWSNASDKEYGSDLATRVKGTVMTIPNGNIGSTLAYEIGKPNTGSSLYDFSVAGVTLSPAFATGTTAYTATVDALPANSAYDIDSVSSRATSSVDTKDNGDGTHTATITVLAEDSTTKTTYTIIYTVPVSCTLAATTPSASASKSTICQGETVTLSATGETGSYSYVWFTNVAKTDTLKSTSVSPTATASYYVVQQESASCFSKMDTVTIVVNVAPEVTVTAVPNAICLGDTTTISAYGATTYTWDNALLTGISGKISLDKTTPIVVIGSTAGCNDTATVLVVVNALPVVTASASPEGVCDGKPSVITASGAKDYVWSNSITGETQTVQPSTDTKYTVTGTDVNGCKDTAEIALKVSPSPVVNAGNDITACFGSAIILVPTGADSYEILDGVTPVTPENIAKKVGETIYKVIGTTAGCKDTDDVKIVISEAPTVDMSASPASLCLGTSTTIKVTEAIGVTYAFDNGVVNNVAFNPSSTKTYYVTATNAEGCKSIDSVTVEVNTTPEKPTIADVAACSNPENKYIMTASSNTSDKYIWSFGGVAVDTANAITVSEIGTYTVSKLAGVCPSEPTTIELTVKPTPATPVSFDVVACTNDSEDKKVPSARGVSGSEIIWYSDLEMKKRVGSGVTPSYDSIKGYNELFVSQVVNGCQSGVYNVSLKTNNAFDTAKITTVLPESVCNTSQAISLAGSPALGSFYIDGIISDKNTFSPATATSGSHTISYIFKNASQCSDTAFATIVVGKPGIPTVENRDLKVSLNAPMPQMSATGTNIVWYDSTMTVIASTDGKCTPSSAYSTATTSTHKFYVRTVEGDCVSDSVQVTVTVSDCLTEAPTVANDKQAVCAGEAFTAFTATKNASATEIKWVNKSNNEVVGETESFIPTEAGSYAVSQFNLCWSSATTVEASINSLPSVSINPIEAICAQSTEGKAVVASPEGGVFSGNVIDGKIFAGQSPIETIIYTYEDANGCSNADTISVSIIALPDAPVIANVEAQCEPALFALTQTGAANVVWTMSGKVVEMPLSIAKAGSYEVVATVSTTEGCTNSDTTTVVVTAAPSAPVIADIKTSYKVGEVIETITATGSDIVWAVNGTATQDVNSAVTSTAEATFVVTAKSVAGTCESAADQITIVITNGSVDTCNQETPVIASIKTSYKVGEAIETITATGSDIVWTVNGTATQDVNASVSSASANTFNITAQSIKGACSSDKATITIVVTEITDTCNQVTPVIANIKTSYTVGEPIESITASGSDIVWKVNGVVSQDVNSAITSNAVAIFDITAQSIKGACSSDIASIIIIVKEKVDTCQAVTPVITAKTSYNINDVKETISATGTNVIWTVNGETVVDPNVAFSTSAAATFVITAQQVLSATCKSEIATTTITVVDPGCQTVAPVVAGTTTVCPGDSATLSAQGTHIEWWSMSGEKLETGNTFKAVAGTYVVSETIGCKATSTVTVSNFTTETVTITPVAPLCSSSPAVTLETSIAGGTFTSEAVTGTSFDPAKAIAGTNLVTYTVEDENSCSISTSTTITVTTTPDVPTITNPQLVYNVNDLKQIISATGTNLEWTVNNNVVTDVNAAISTAKATVYNISVKSVSGTCKSESASTTVTVEDNTCATPAPVVRDSTICSGQSASLTAEGTDIKWYASASSNSIIATTIVRDITSTSTYYATQTLNGCEGPRASATVTVKAQPKAPEVTPGSACAGLTGEVKATGSNLKWYESATSSTVVSELSEVEVSEAKTLYVSQSIEGCESQRAPVSFIVLSTPSIISVANQTVEPNATATFTAPTNAKWYNEDSSYISTGTTFEKTATEISMVYTYLVSSFNGSCESAKTPFTLTVKAANCPDAPIVITPKVAICAGDSKDITAVSSSDVAWYDVAIGGTAIAEGNTYTASSAGTYYAAQSNGTCESPRTKVTVVVNEAPVVSFVDFKTTATTIDTEFEIKTNPLLATLSKSTGLNVSTRMFDPAIAGEGTKTITATYTDPTTGCSGYATATITIEIGGLNKTILISTIDRGVAKKDENIGNTGVGIGEYPQSALDALQAAITKAQTAKEAATTQEEIDAADSALKTAITVFEESINISNKTSLISAVNKASNIADTATTGTAIGQYPVAAKNALTSAIAEAQAIIDNPKSTQPEVNAAVIAMNNAITTFEGTVRKAVLATSITLESSSITKPVGKTFELTYEVEPVDATNATLVWSSNNEDVATVSEDGIVTILKPGRAKITVTVKGTSISDNITINAVTEDEIAEGEALVVYPSVASTNVYVKGAKNISKVTIVSVDSKEVIRSSSTSADVLIFDLDRVIPGKYSVVMKTKKGSIVVKSFIKE